MSAAALATLAARYLLVMLFFPFSAADKIFNFRGAVAQARQIAPHNFAVILILAGLATEILMPLAILTGIADRAAAFVLAGYCMVTALLWKQFWKPGDFWRAGDSKGRDLFWDFLKNFSLAGGSCCWSSAPMARSERSSPTRSPHLTLMRRRARHDRFRIASEHRLLASVARRNGRQPSAAMRTDGVRAQGRRSGRSAMEQPPATRRSHDRLYRAAGRLGWGLDENPAPQWIVPLSGRWWVEAMDGTRVEMGPGDVSFGEDQGCIATADGRRGHRSGTIGDEPAVLMTVQLHAPPVLRPCHLR